jgi:hypothetical protein
LTCAAITDPARFATKASRGRVGVLANVSISPAGR